MAFHWVENVNTASFTPREYQVELIDAARDRNIIMCLAQNSARDFIALKIIQEHANELRSDVLHMRKKSVYLVDEVRVESVATMLKYLTDLDVGLVKNPSDLDHLEETVQVLVTTPSNYANALICSYIDFRSVNVMIVENCHNVVKEDNELKQVMDYIRSEFSNSLNTRIVAMTGPLYSCKCFGGFLSATVQNIEKLMLCEVETASDIVSSLRYSTQPAQLLIECHEPISHELDLVLRKHVNDVRSFLADHRFAPYEIYDEEYIDELNAMCDPKEEPNRILDEFITTLDEFGVWCADKAAYNYLVYLQKQKLKTPYERHYLLLSLVETLLVKIRCICDYELSKYNEIDRIIKYSTPKVLRLMSVIRSFKSETSSSCLETNIQALNECNFKSLSDQIVKKCEELSSDNNEVEKLINNFKDMINVSDDLQDKVTNIEEFDCSKDSGQGSSLSSNLAIDRSSSNTINNSPKFNKQNKSDQHLRKQRTSKRNSNVGHRGPRSNYYQLDPDALCGIIIVESKCMAKILFALLCELTRHHPDYEFLNVQFTAEKSADPILDPKDADAESRVQEDVLRRFRMHECNLLIGTAMLEHGIDMPRCNLVLHWNVPNSFSSFAHSKGRARASSALHAFLVTSSSTDSAVCKLAEYCEVEQMLLSKCNNMEPSECDEKYADRFTNCIKSYQPSCDENSASVNLLSSIALVNRYCAKLPSDTFTRLAPLWKLYELNRNGRILFQCVVRLPINSPIKKDIIGCPVPSKILARRIAAFQTCVELHKGGELDDNLQPLGKECLKVQEELHLLDFFDEDACNTDTLEPRPGTTKRRQYYFKKIADALCECKPIEGEPCHFYEIHMHLTCPLPDEHNTRGRQIYDPEDSPNGFGILTRKFMPKIGSFPIFTRSGEVSVSINLIQSSIIITKKRMEMIYKFINYTFTKVLKLQKLFMIFDPDISNHSYFIVPTLKVDQTIQVDWNFLEVIHAEEYSKQILAHNCADTTVTPTEPKNEYIFDPEKFRDAVVMPWYRNQDTPQYFYVAEICKDLNPLSPFPGSNFKCFEHYYRSKYNIKVGNLSQPLLDVDHTSGRLNFLTPRYVNRKGIALPTSSEETKRAKREDLSNKQILIPELCTVHAFPGALWRAAVCLPCTLYRVNGLLVADQIRAEVAKDIGLGTKQLAESAEWPKLDFGWSLAEVYSKSKNKINNPIVESVKVDPIEIVDALNSKSIELLNEKSEEVALINDNPDENQLEIGLWSNDMAPLDNETNYNAVEGVRFSSPTQWNSNSNRDPSEIYSDSDCDGSFDNYSDDDDECDGSAADTGRLHIEFQSDNLAEAIDNDSHNRNLPLFMSQNNDNVELDWKISDIDPVLKTEFVQQYNDRIKKIRENIINNGSLIRSEVEVPTRKMLLKNQVPKFSESNSHFMHELIYCQSSTNLGNQISIEELIELNEIYVKEHGEDSKRLINNADHYEGIDMDKVFSNLDKNKNKKVIKPHETDFKFSFDYQPDLEKHPGPSPSLILQALTMSNANDGINLERLETIGDSFLKYAITTYLYCTYDNIHEGKLSHLRSLQVSNLHLYRLGYKKNLGESMIATKFEPHDNWLPPCFHVPKDLEDVLTEANIPASLWDMVNVPLSLSLPKDELVKQVRRRAIELGLLVESTDEKNEGSELKRVLTESDCGPSGMIPYNLITQHSIPDKSIADCVEALIGAYLIECGPRGALLFMSWLGIKVLPLYEKPCTEQEAKQVINENIDRNAGYLKPVCRNGQWIQPFYGNIVIPPSPLVKKIKYPEQCLENLLIGYDVLEEHLGYKFKDRSYLLQAMTHASYSPNRLTDCYQRLEFLGDAVLDYLITRHLYDAPQKHSPGALTDLRSALVNNIIFASLAVRHGFHRYFLHRSPGLHEVIARFVAVQEASGHAITEEYYLMEEDECEAVEDVEIPKALGDLFESVAGAIFLDSGMSLDAVWRVYYTMMQNELTQFGNSVPKSPIRELLEMEPETAKFGKPEKLADGRRVRVTVEVFGKGTFKGIGRNYRIAKCTAAKCALKKLKARNKQT